MLFGFDRWSDELGWWVPNSTICSASEDPVTHAGQWRYPDGEIIRHELMHGHRDARFGLVSDMGDESYVYPIFIRNCGYFEDNRDVGFRHVSDRAMADIRAGRSIMVLAMPLEGSSGSTSYPDDPGILDSWCEEAGLYRHQVFYVSGNQLVADLSRGRRFTGVPFMGFHCWLDGCRDAPVPFNPTDGHDLLLCLNRIAKPHRSLVVCELVSHGLRDRCLLSYDAGGSPVAVAHMAKWGRHDLMEAAGIVDGDIPIIADRSTTDWNPAGSLDSSHHERTFMDLVTETEAREGQVFFSEKIFKPISQGHPFMVVAGRGYLSRLRAIGYQTFGEWWDEGYDDLEDLDDRVSAIMREVSRLSAHGTSVLRDIREDMLPVLRHNMEVFREQHSICYGRSQDAPLHAVLLDILGGRHA